MTLAAKFDVPPVLWMIGEQLEPRFGRLRREYGQIFFDQQFLERDPTLPGDGQVKLLIEQALDPFLTEVAATWRQETNILRRHLEISLHTLINRENLKYADLHARVEAGEINLRPALKRSEERLEELNHRLETRLADLDKERHCTIAYIQHLGRAWVLPPPERKSPGIASMVRDDEVERLAIERAIAYEHARGWVVESVAQNNRGFDSRTHR